MDHLDKGTLDLSELRYLVLDEADRMLDMGFIPDIEEICTKLPAQRQTLLFSATMPAPIKKLADKFLSNPKSIEVARPATANTNRRTTTPKPGHRPCPVLRAMNRILAPRQRKVNHAHGAGGAPVGPVLTTDEAAHQKTIAGK